MNNVNLTLTEAEINEVLNCLDLAVKQTGLKGCITYVNIAQNIVAQTNTQLVDNKEVKENE